MAEELPRANVLEQEGIADGDFAEASRNWRIALASSADLHLAYLSELHTAEDCLARRLDPLDSDPSLR